MKGKYLVGIDVGTTGTKTVVFDNDGTPIAKAYTEYGSIYPQPGWVEQDANLILQATLSTCQKAVANVSPSPN